MSRNILKFSFAVLILSAVIRTCKTEVYPESLNSNSYFQRFTDLEKLKLSLRNSEYQRAVSQVNNVLLTKPLLGIDKLVVDSGRTQEEGQENVRKLFDNLPFRRKRTVYDEAVNVSDTTTVLTPPTRVNASTSTDSALAFQTSEESTSDSSVTSPNVPATTSSGNLASRCVQDTQTILTSAINNEQWSLQFLDSWGKPGSGILTGQLNFVGNYKECRSSQAPVGNDTNSRGFSGNYCVVGLSMAGASIESLTGLLSGSGALQIGTCLPSTCSSADVFSLVGQGLVAANLTSVLAVASVDCRTEYREYTTATILAIIFLSIIALLMVLGTAYDILFVQYAKWVVTRKIEVNEANGFSPIETEEIYVEASLLQKEKKSVLTNGGGDLYDGKRNGAASQLYSESKPLIGKRKHKKSTCSDVLTKVLLSFSVYTNGKKMLNTSQAPGSLGAIHGIRFLSMSWVILGHIYIFAPASFVNMATAMPEMLGRWTFDAISNALVSVDTFFALSGLLLSYLTTKEIQKKGWKLNWAMYYFHRFWRLTPPYMLVLLTALGLSRFFGSGALWNSTQPQDKINCEDNWWTNLLYVNNLVNADQMCMGHSWYLANDMQFYLLSPLMIVPFYFNVYAGIGSCLVFILTSWITTGVLSTQNSWSTSILNVAIAQLQPEGSDRLDFMRYYYYAPYCRIGPFVIGILAGYILAVTKGNIRMKWYYAVIGWVLAISVGLASVYGVHGDITGENASSNGTAAFYNTMARSAWGACVCWVIVACVSGYGGPVDAILSWSPFVVLGRLTYMAYLIHPTVIVTYFQNMDQLYLLNDTNIVISYLGILVFTNMASFILVLGFESPMIGLEKVFLGRS